MSVRVGATTKGLVKNNSTGEIQKFQFNPSGFQYSRGVTYATIDAPGMAYPETQFVKGNAREFSVTLKYFEKPYKGKFREVSYFFGALITPEVNSLTYTKPPEMTFAFGNWVRTCVLTDLNIDVIETDSDLNPTHFDVTLSIRQVGV